MLKIEEDRVNQASVAFCRSFAKAARPKFLLGRNEYARSITRVVDVNGIIDDFTDQTEFQGKPVVKMKNVPGDGLVVSCVLGRPWTAARALDALDLNHLDYFAFARFSGLDIPPVSFWEGFDGDFEKHNDKYHWIYDSLRDEESKDTFSKIIHFRLYKNVRYMSAFTDRQEDQYFEDLLGLDAAGETFVDVGGYDGATSLEFAKRCPHYKSIHLFEPDKDNLAVAKERLSTYPNVWCYPLGLSDGKRRLTFKPGGSTAQISESGSVAIDVDKMDDVLKEDVSFIKMDVEGGEAAAIAGARRHILSSCPKLAICVYHKSDDLWRIPQQVLSMRSDYDLYLRHYTEGVVETVMFFVPK